MDKYKIYNYSIDEFCTKEEIVFVVENSTPTSACSLNYVRTKADFDLGEFIFFFKNKKEEFKIAFHNESENLNDLWKFLENIINLKEVIVLALLYNGEEIVLYIEPYSKTKVRFVVFNTIEACRKFKNREILNYSYKDSKIDLDIIIAKKRLIGEFYKILRELFINFDAIAFFEPPYINYDFWIKDSTKIKNFLNIK